MPAMLPQYKARFQFSGAGFSAAASDTLMSMKNVLPILRALLEGLIGLFLPLNTAAGIATWHRFTPYIVVLQTMWASICVLLCYLLLRDATRVLKMVG
jgi:hypothetical protein